MHVGGCKCWILGCILHIHLKDCYCPIITTCVLSIRNRESFSVFFFPLPKILVLLSLFVSFSFLQIPLICDIFKNKTQQQQKENKGGKRRKKKELFLHQNKTEFILDGYGKRNLNLLIIIIKTKTEILLTRFSIFLMLMPLVIRHQQLCSVTVLVQK